MTSDAELVEAGNDDYRDNHFAKMFKDGFSFSGYERDGLYLNLGESHRYMNISGVSGADSETDGRASVFADFDNDGDTDIFITTIQGESHLLFRNNIGNLNRSIRVTLEGTESGRDAYGAVVRMKTSSGTLTKIKAGGSGYLSQHDPRLLFGLNEDEEAIWVEVTWPSGIVQKFERIPAGSSIRLVEGAETLRYLEEKTGSLPNPLSKDASLLANLKIQPGSRFPSLGLTAIGDGAPTTLESLRVGGRRHLVNLWATWCIPCRTEIPELQTLLPEFEQSGIDLIGISLDTRDRSYVGKFLDRMGATYPNYLAPADAAGKIYATDEVFVPLSFVVDDQGIVEEIFGGWSNESLRRLKRLAEQ